MNPFKKDTISYDDFEKMKDLKWHCAICELKSGQAKTWQIWRQKGIQLDTDEGKKDKFNKRIFCPKCNRITIHRKLKSLTVLPETKERSGISAKLALKIKKVYSNEEAILLRKMFDNELEVDHKFPQIRWGQNEEENKEDMSETEIKDKFILLTRANNLLKSRYCEKCKQTGKRGVFPGIYFWYEGSETWASTNENDSKGCEGCFWFDPYKWRVKLNEILLKLKK
jgi:hypothetical protein